MNDNLKEFKKILEENQHLVDFLSGVYVYGSFLYKDFSGDLDLIMVMKKYDSKLIKLIEIIQNVYGDVDLDVYTEEEIKTGLPYRSKEFKLEYLAKSKCIMGDPNLFIGLFSDISIADYKNSILVRTVDHIQKVRLKYTDATILRRDKIKFIRKYYFRILKNILLYSDYGNYTTVNDLLEEGIILNINNKFPDMEIKNILFTNNFEDSVQIFEEMIKIVNILKIKN